MNKEQVQKELDKLIREEHEWRQKGYKAAKPFIKEAHKIHLKWAKIYNKKYIWMEEDKETKKSITRD